MESIYAKGRDNSRTPMQWDNTVNAGFTMGTPWIKVNPNYININVQAAISNPDSIYHYYRKLISLRKKHKVIVYGSYDLLLENHSEIFAYKRALDGETVIVICNFSEKEIKTSFLEDIPRASCERLLSNYPNSDKRVGGEINLRAYEVQVYLLK